MKQHIAIDKATPNVGALDFSHLLDASGGKHGHVTVKDGHLLFCGWHTGPVYWVQPAHPLQHARP